MIEYTPPTLIGGLPQSSERDTSVKGRKTLFTYNRVDRMACISVSRSLQRIGKGVLLRLQANFDHFHRADNCDRLGRTSREAGYVEQSASSGRRKVPS